jgi:hypothetical protein
MVLDNWLIEAILTILAALLVGYIAVWFVSQFNKDK